MHEEADEPPAVVEEAGVGAMLVPPIPPPDVQTDDETSLVREHGEAEDREELVEAKAGLHEDHGDEEAKAGVEVLERAVQIVGSGVAAEYLP